MCVAAEQKVLGLLDAAALNHSELLGCMSPEIASDS